MVGKRTVSLAELMSRDVYRADDGTLFAVDTQHGRFEQVNAKTGEHMGEVSMMAFSRRNRQIRRGGTI